MIRKHRKDCLNGILNKAFDSKMQFCFTKYSSISFLIKEMIDLSSRYVGFTHSYRMNYSFLKNKHESLSLFEYICLYFDA